MTGTIRRPGTDPDDDLTPFRNVRSWVFDLDDTLYAMTPDLAATYDWRMTEFIARTLGMERPEAAMLREQLYSRYGATVRGLMTEHGITPDEYLSYVHDVDHSSIPPNPRLAAAIARLPGPRYVLTNSPLRHAESILGRLGMTGLFDEVFDFMRAGQHAKPSRAVYDLLLAETGIDPAATAMFEDLARNLAEPQALGMSTVLVLPPGTRELFRANWDLEAGPRPAADFLTEDLPGFLEAVLEGLE